MILAQLAHFASHTVSSLAFFQEEQTVSFSPLGLWRQNQRNSLLGFLAADHLQSNRTGNRCAPAGVLSPSGLHQSPVLRLGMRLFRDSHSGQKQGSFLFRKEPEIWIIRPA